MLLTTFTVRLVDSARRVLAWAELPCEARGDGAIWSSADFDAIADETGDGVGLIWHWPDVNVHGTLYLNAAIAVQAGRRVIIPWLDRQVVVLPSDTQLLPAVTVRTSVTVTVPTGELGVHGN